MLKKVSFCNYFRFLSQLKSTMAKYLQELSFAKLRQCLSVVNEIESIPFYAKKYNIPDETSKKVTQEINTQLNKLKIKYHALMNEAERLDKKASQLFLSSAMHLNQAIMLAEDVTVLVDYEKVVSEFIESLVQEFTLDSNDLSLYYQSTITSGLNNQAESSDIIIKRKGDDNMSNQGIELINEFQRLVSVYYGIQYELDIFYSLETFCNYGVGVREALHIIASHKDDEPMSPYKRKAIIFIDNIFMKGVKTSEEFYNRLHILGQDIATRYKENKLSIKQVILEMQKNPNPDCQRIACSFLDESGNLDLEELGLLIAKENLIIEDQGEDFPGTSGRTGIVHI